MLLFKYLPINLVLLIADILPSASATLVPRSIQKVHGAAVSLARDLRMAFGGILVAQPSPPNQRVAYCKLGTSGGAPVPVVDGGAPTNTTPTQGPSQFPSATSRTTASGPRPTSTAPPSSPWKLFQSYEGDSFFDGWQFATERDKTGGIVQYVDQDTARRSGLLDINGEGNIVMRVETTANVPDTRQSIRIETTTLFNGGLFIMDSVHVPTGCGTWPAFWTCGPNWPAGGEIDVFEGVHDYTHNQATIHTDPGCMLPTTNTGSLGISGTLVGGIDCAVNTTGNQGCGIRAAGDNTFGRGFNANGGGTYAMKWDADGVAVYFFPRGSEPADATAGRPLPETWGAAQARWPSTNCDPFRFFSNHRVVFDTTLCGDWAGAVWGVAGVPGQEQSCAERTGFPTCEAFVRANGASFAEAYWEVKSVKIYQFAG